MALELKLVNASVITRPGSRIIGVVHFGGRRLVVGRA